MNRTRAFKQSRFRNEGMAMIAAKTEGLTVKEIAIKLLAENR